MRNWFRRKRRTAMVNTDYALLYHKVARRLGVVRAQNRQLRNENGYLSDQLTELRLDIVDEAKALARQLSVSARSRAEALEQRDRDRSELMAKHIARADELAETVVRQQETIAGLQNRIDQLSSRTNGRIPANDLPGI